MNNPLITIIIPCYNGEKHIHETLDSINIQSFKNYEVIVINDGSTDNSKSIIENYTNFEIRYVFQENKGVSNARNSGLKLSKGKYITFLDADDILSEDFLKSRLSFLEQSPEFDFCCGSIQTFISNPNSIIDTFKGIANNLNDEMFLIDAEYSSVPSGYLFRKSILSDKNIVFNEKLSSTADRYFLIEVSYVAKGFCSDELSVLYYRISDSSMSHKLNYKLVSDNELFLNELIKNDLIPKEYLIIFKLKMSYILFAAYFKINKFYLSIKYFICYSVFYFNLLKIKKI